MDPFSKSNLYGFLRSKEKSHADGLNNDFAVNLHKFLTENPHGAGIGSGFRSVERQKQLFDQAVAKYGSEATARKWVAPPGRSNHNHGLAADLKYNNDEARTWAHANAAKYGLAFPMSHENWHVEPVGAREMRAQLPSTTGAPSGVAPLPQAAAAGPAFGLAGPQSPVPSVMNDLTPDISKTADKGILDTMKEKFGGESGKGMMDGLDQIAKGLKGGQQQDSGFLPVKGDDGSQAARFQAASQLMAQLMGPKRPRGIMG
jgi:hypothetical protein